MPRAEKNEHVSPGKHAAPGPGTVRCRLTPGGVSPGKHPERGMTCADRHRVSEQFDLFLPYFADPPLRDQCEMMERPFFSAAGHRGRQAEATALQALPDRLLSHRYWRGADGRR